MAKRERTLRRYLNFVKFEHTLFALPFAYGGMLLAAGGWPGWNVVAWISLAMVGARTASMALNRVFDAGLDSQNPRTADREIPTGRLSRADGLGLAVAGFTLLAVAAWALNPLTLALLPVAVLFLAVYPVTKRFTWLCHYWLGLTIGAAAAGGWIAVTGAFSSAAVALWAGVGLWIAGFDIIYSLLDLEFDRDHDLHSVAVRFGPQRALALSAVSHLLSLMAFTVVLLVAPVGIPYGVSLVAVAAVLAIEHRLVRRRSTAAALASFNANLYVSGIVLLGIVIDLWV